MNNLRYELSNVHATGEYFRWRPIDSLPELII